VTIISKSVTGIAAGDQIEIEILYTLLNNSGANRQFTPLTALGAISVSLADGANVGSNATNRKPVRHIVTFSVSATNLTKAHGVSLAPDSNAGGPTAINTANSMMTWASSASDITGTQTLSFTVNSSNTTATQTLTLH